MKITRACLVVGGYLVSGCTSTAEPPPGEPLQRMPDQLNANFNTLVSPAMKPCGATVTSDGEAPGYQTFSYDDAGALLEEEDTGPEVGESIQTYKYDGAGHEIDFNIREPGTAADGNAIVDWVTDLDTLERHTASHMRQTYEDGKLVVSIDEALSDWDAQGNAGSVVQTENDFYANTSSTLTRTLLWDDYGREVAETDHDTELGALDTITISYDDVNRVETDIDVTTQLPGGTPLDPTLVGTTTSTWTYDAAFHLLQFTVAGVDGPYSATLTWEGDKLVSELDTETPPLSNILFTYEYGHCKAHAPDLTNIYTSAASARPSLRRRLVAPGGARSARLVRPR